MCIPELLRPYFEMPVGIFGCGVSGRAVAQVLDNLQVPYVMYDKDESRGVCVHFTNERARKHSLIVYSPGFSRNHSWIKLARDAGCECLGELDFGALFWKGKIIAVTGTNGKSTLTSLLGEALTSLGINEVVACGNIGSPLTAQYEYFEDPQAIAVCEVSSFQSETISHFSPDVLIWTTFDVDHLDRHPDLRSYFDAKWNLVDRLKTRELFVGKTVVNYAKEYGYSLPLGTVVGEADAHNELLPEGMFGSLPQSENYLLALGYWVSQGFNVEVLKKTALSFQPLPHRLRKIAEINDIGFWNDSKGTNFSATIAALRGFKERVFWIGGGKVKGGDQGMFVDKISPFIEEAFLIGESALILEARLRDRKLRVQRYFSLDEAIEAAHDRAVLSKKKQEIVFSPGFSSFDMFNNAEERGNFFEKKVLELKTTQNTLETIKDINNSLI